MGVLGRRALLLFGIHKSLSFGNSQLYPRIHEAIMNLLIRRLGKEVADTRRNRALIHPLPIRNALQTGLTESLLVYIFLLLLPVARLFGQSIRLAKQHGILFREATDIPNLLAHLFQRPQTLHLADHLAPDCWTKTSSATAQNGNRRSASIHMNGPGGLARMTLGPHSTQVGNLCPP